jgi:hypothetical protein
MTPEKRRILLIEPIRAIRIGGPVSKGGVTLLLNRVQFETRRFQFRSSPSERPWKGGTTGFKLDAV